MSEAMAYVGIDENGDCVAAHVIDPKWAKDTAKFVADMVKDGLTVERKSCEWVRQNLTVPRPKKKQSAQADLFA